MARPLRLSAKAPSVRRRGTELGEAPKGGGCHRFQQHEQHAFHQGVEAGVVGDADAAGDLNERKKTAAVILAAGSFGFLFLGLISLLVSRGGRGTIGWLELMVAGAVAIAIGIFLIVAIFSVWYNKSWVGRWTD